MKYLPVIALLYLLPALLVATPLSEENEETPLKDTLTSFLRVRRQAPQSACTTDNQCLSDPSLLDVPATLVQCTSGVCECNDCFMADAQGNCSSTLCPDYLFNSVNNICGNDNRPSQLTAFLLSLFLSGTGAANFYIGQNGLGGGQIALIVITFLMSYLMCCFPCCLACCMEDVKGSIIFILLMLVAVIIVVIVSFMMSAWWIADVIIFATNQRLAGNGCILTPNL